MSPRTSIQNYFFIGIGGIGMSALARYFKYIGKQVAGYDRTASEITESLQEEGIPVSFIDVAEAIPEAFLPENTLVVFTPAVSKQNTLLQSLQTQGYAMIKRAALLGEITSQTQCLAVAGTHGKTTTTAILGHLLAFANQEVTAFLGGVSENYQTNLIRKGNKVTVVEADEFDRSFLQLHPFIAGITSMDADHLDIYGDESSIRDAFQAFAALVPKQGVLLHKKGLPLKGKTVAVEEPADFEAQNVRIENGVYHFDLKTPDSTIENLMLNLPGRHNLFNAVLALGMAISFGVPTSSLPKALFTFKGVKRRFSYQIKKEDFVLIDDYAHHPAEIDAVHQAVREMYPDKKATVVFQPHLFSRTKDFSEAFATALAQFDAILLLEIYPAREEPIPGITSGWLLDKINNPKKKIVTKEALPRAIADEKNTVVVMLGAGDIGEEVKNVKTYFSHEN